MCIWMEPLSIPQHMSLSSKYLSIHKNMNISYFTTFFRKKNLSLPGDGSFKAFVDSFVVKEPVQLIDFLRGFSIFLPGVV